MPLLAKEDVTVHTLIGDSKPDDALPAVKSVTLGFGDTLEEEMVPAYVLEAVKNGEVAGLERVSKAEAEKAGKQAEDARVAAGTQVINGSNAEQDANKA